jgi:hypothetical protein
MPTRAAAVRELLRMGLTVSGTDGDGGAVFRQVDRITGDVEAALEHWSHETNPAKLRSATRYSLK